MDWKNKEQILADKFPDTLWVNYLSATAKKKICEAMEIYSLQSRIQERKDCIYNLEQDLLDNGPEGEGIYSEDYRRCINDEISNHKAFIEDLEKELLKLQQTN